MADTGSEVFLPYFGGLPGERFCALVVADDEGIDLLPDLLGGGEGGPLERGAAENGEPDLDLVQPGGVGWREMEMHVGMACQPEVTLGLVRVQIVEHDVDFPTGMVGHDAVHEVEKLDPAPAPVVPRLDLAGGNVQSGK